jgi:hypothetical protein
LIGVDAAKPDWTMLKNFFLMEGKIGKELAVKLIKQCMDILSKAFL